MRSAIDESIIEEASESKSYPAFQPHVTLVGSVPSSPLPSSTIQNVLSVTRSPVDLKFKQVEMGDHYFRSVYLAMHLTDDLVDLHGRMHLNLGIHPQTPKFPHLSLAYITDEDAGNGEREKYYERLQICVPGLARLGEDGSIEINIGQDEEHWISEFPCGEAWVVECNGPVEGWTVLEKIPFGQ